MQSIFLLCFVATLFSGCHATFHTCFESHLWQFLGCYVQPSGSCDRLDTSSGTVWLANQKFILSCNHTDGQVLVNATIDVFFDPGCTVQLQNTRWVDVPVIYEGPVANSTFIQMLSMARVGWGLNLGGVDNVTLFQQEVVDEFNSIPCWNNQWAVGRPVTVGGVACPGGDNCIKHDLLAVQNNTFFIGFC